MSEFTQLLAQIETGDPNAAALLLPLVYGELRNLAAARLSHEKPGQTLDATSLVHEAYLRLVNGAQPQEWNGRGHFFGAAAEAMRRILVERARKKSRVRHGGNAARVSLTEVPAERELDAHTVLVVDEALTRLAEEEPEVAEVVKLHFFAGLTLDETAEALGIAKATVYRKWSYARACLRVALSDTPASQEE